jgi:hypothetical protein
MRGQTTMKWKKYRESINPDVPYIPSKFILHDVDEITPELDSYGSLASDADFMIQQYINDQAKKYYTNGIIPDDEEEELRSYLTPIYVEFEYWCEEDEEYDAGYEDGKIMFIIDASDNKIIDSDTFSKDIPEDVVDRAREEALKYIKSHN